MLEKSSLQLKLYNSLLKTSITIVGELQFISYKYSIVHAKASKAL